MQIKLLDQKIFYLFPSQHLQTQNDPGKEGIRFRFEVEYFTAVNNNCCFLEVLNGRLYYCFETRPTFWRINENNTMESVDGSFPLIFSSSFRFFQKKFFGPNWITKCDLSQQDDTILIIVISIFSKTQGFPTFSFFKTNKYNRCEQRAHAACKSVERSTDLELFESCPRIWASKVPAIWCWYLYRWSLNITNMLKLKNTSFSKRGCQW